MKFSIRFRIRNRYGAASSYTLRDHLRDVHGVKEGDHE